MMGKPVQHESEQGQLVFSHNQAVAVNYWAADCGADGWRGQVSHAEGHPDWHPIVAAHPGPFTLVMRDGRKLKVFLESLQGLFHGTGD
jgi:hypothetical protein